MERIRQFEPLFGDWHIESLIGAGSFGRVYKIYRDELDTRFYSALKHISIPEDEGEVNQLRIDGMDERSISTYYTELTKSITEETKLMNRLRGNTNIVSFEDSKVIPKEGGVGYDIFIRMELLTSLPARLVDAPLTEAETVRLGADICSALELCGKYGIIHRDIKPDNIFISDTGAFKLGDFGVARKLENTSGYMSKKGTYNYMAPEVYRGEKYGPRCDIYSLGLVMYRLLNNGRLPFLPAAPKMITPNDRETSLVRRMSGVAKIKLQIPAGAAKPSPPPAALTTRFRRSSSRPAHSTRTTATPTPHRCARILKTTLPASPFQRRRSPLPRPSATTSRTGRRPSPFSTEHPFRRRRSPLFRRSVSSPSR